MTLLRIVTLLVWTAVGASAVSWWLSGTSLTRPAGQAVAVAPAATVPPADWSSMLGAGSADAVRPNAQSAAADASRFRLLGVAGPVRSDSRNGVALLSVDGAPARAFKVGQMIDGQLTVLAITAHEVRIGPVGGATALTLQAPLMPPPATGSLPGG